MEREAAFPNRIALLWKCNFLPSCLFSKSEDLHWNLTFRKWSCPLRKRLDNKYRNEVYSRVLRLELRGYDVSICSTASFNPFPRDCTGFFMSDELSDCMRAVPQLFEEAIMNNVSRQNGYAFENTRTLNYSMKNTLQENCKTRPSCKSIICLFR